MWIERDLESILAKSNLLEAVLVQGPRQVGKSSFLEHFTSRTAKVARLDDLSVRTRANSDPALFLEQFFPPVVIDEFQYAPALLPELKLRIDEVRRKQREKDSVHGQLFFLSGSNQIEIDKSIKETLAGRVSLVQLHGLSIHEIIKKFPNISLPELLWRGGFPELYAREALSPIEYINDYISTFIEKDIARSGGISKLEEFLTVVKLLAARVSGILNRDSLASDAGVAPKTVSEWIDILSRTQIVYLLPVYSSNLNSRLTKAPKLYFVDTALATRLQGHLAQEAILGSPQAGNLFENIIVAEILKAKDHWRVPCTLSYWRTKEKEELDLIISYGDMRIFFEVKLAIQGAVNYSVPSSLKKEFGESLKIAVVTVGGKREEISHDIDRVPFRFLGDYLKESLGLFNHSLCEKV